MGYLREAEVKHGLFSMVVALGFPGTKEASRKLRAIRVSDDHEWDPLNLLPSDPTIGFQPAVFLVPSPTAARLLRSGDERGGDRGQTGRNCIRDALRMRRVPHHGGRVHRRLQEVASRKKRGDQRRAGPQRHPIVLQTG